MMDFISVPLVVGIVCAGIYGLFELFVRKRERLAIIEKIGDKLDASAFDGKLGLPNYMRNFSFSSLKAGQPHGHGGRDVADQPDPQGLAARSHGRPVAGHPAHGDEMGGAGTA